MVLRGERLVFSQKVAFEGQSAAIHPGKTDVVIGGSVSVLTPPYARLDLSTEPATMRRTSLINYNRNSRAMLGFHFEMH